MRDVIGFEKSLLKFVLLEFRSLSRCRDPGHGQTIVYGWRMRRGLLRVVGFMDLARELSASAMTR